MTLFKQLLITVSIIFALLLSVVYSLEFNSAKQFLSEQQATNVINTTNSLGVALVPYLDSGDKIGAQAVIKAVFDGGYYRQISLELYANNEKIVNKNSSKIEGVPAWFTSLNFYSQVSHEQVLTSGWLQLGKIKVIGHQGYVYRQLWRSMSDLLTTFIVGYLITLILLIRALTFLLRPLNQIKQQAIEIQERQPGHHIQLPKTLELKELVSAFNLMSAKLAQQFKEQASEAEALRRRVFQDETSGLGNRAYFVSQVNSWVAEDGRGGVILLSVDILDDIYRNEGFSARDDLIKTVAEKLQSEINYIEQSAVARISASEFAILLPGFEGDELQFIGNKFYKQISDLVATPSNPSSQACAIGLAQRHAGAEVGELLTLADNALQLARGASSPGAVLAVSSHNEHTMGRMGWKSLVCSAVDEHFIKLKAQPVHLIEGNALQHVELFAFIKTKESEYHAGQFLPAVEQYNLGQLFDCYVLTQVVEKIKAGTLGHVAVNLTVCSLKDLGFRAWLINFMKENQAYASQLVFELPESALIGCCAEIVDLCQSIREQGFNFGVDQYGRHIQSLDYLSKLMPQYVKIEFGYTAQVINEQGDAQLLEAICKVANNLKILTIAQRIETNDQRELLAGLSIDGYQGYLYPPEELSDLT